MQEPYLKSIEDKVLRSVAAHYEVRRVLPAWQRTAKFGAGLVVVSILGYANRQFGPVAAGLMIAVSVLSYYRGRKEAGE
jgi:hypothetical protein